MARGAVVMAQFRVEKRSRSLGLRVTPTTDSRLDAAHKKELEDPVNEGLEKLTVAAFIFDLGLAAYEARDEIGINEFRKVAAAHGGDEGKAFADLIKRGFASWSADHTPRPGKK